MPKRYHNIPTIAAITMCVLLPAPDNSGQVTAQLAVPGAGRTLGSPLDRLEPRLPRRLEKRQPDPVLPETEELIEDGTATIEAAGTSLDDTLQQVNASLRPFRQSQTEQGELIEADRLVILLPAGQLQQLEQSGLDVTAVRELTGLGLIMVTARQPQDTELDATIKALRETTTDSSVDFNHLYKFAAPPNAAAPQSLDRIADTEMPGQLRIGMIDSTVQSTHPTFQGVNIETVDFSPHEGYRIDEHGTAVASLLTARKGRDIMLYAAAVFFEHADSGSATTAEAIIAALDWLVREQVAVINISITGPHNALLQRAVAAAVARDVPVVAAVGNNGPYGEPLYPAAYAPVIGVTAVGHDHQAYLYANRGPHVEYAAVGVDVRIANSTGGWQLGSGTSLAAPVVTRAIAELRSQQPLSVLQLRSRLSVAATDLGDAGVDPVYGNGLITNNPPVSAAAATGSENQH